MKIFIFSLAIILIFSAFLIYQQDYNIHQRESTRLKFIAEEASAAASQYYKLNKYGDGELVFNREEGIKAAEYVIKENMKLNDDFTPKSKSYWQDKIEYTIKFFDDDNTTYPITYKPFDDFSIVVVEPTVVIEIDAGSARYRLPYFNANVKRSAAHEWQGRK